ncbi:unnamed protein product [Didymodactylos carnosus]|uniref:Reverse transcriptase domain-containing protein n=1 Tax=Didymodactylos carnosus TaxID=1234261 RepID=A0A815WNC6_9BILA|nr:unnamed protein product [Didymodactylos carnosus]CAF1547556.1 unnamed protein product [Didymodactylos carnosus]CAF4224171.1 unnamed protein product [Didymodactylos carnosus]CAF4408336.1 unnamed protein product [Didymodactylos carnosus]
MLDKNHVDPSAPTYHFQKRIRQLIEEQKLPNPNPVDDNNIILHIPPPILYPRQQLKRLLEIAVCNIPFRFLNKTYLQIEGVAMGSPLGPILADLFMTKLEQNLSRFSTNKP